MSESRPPFPPFTKQSAAQKVQAAEDAWTQMQAWLRKYKVLS